MINFFRHQPADDCANPFAPRYLAAFALRNVGVFILLIVAVYYYRAEIARWWSPPLQTPAFSTAPMPEPFVPANWQVTGAVGPLDDAGTLFAVTVNIKPNSLKWGMLIWDARQEKPVYARLCNPWMINRPVAFATEDGKHVVYQVAFGGYRRETFGHALAHPPFETPFDNGVRGTFTAVVFANLETGEDDATELVPAYFSPMSYDMASHRILGTHDFIQPVPMLCERKTGRMTHLPWIADLAEFDGPDHVLLRARSSTDKPISLRVDLNTLDAEIVHGRAPRNPYLGSGYDYYGTFLSGFAAYPNPYSGPFGGTPGLDTVVNYQEGLSLVMRPGLYDKETGKVRPAWRTPNQSDAPPSTGFAPGMMGTDPFGAPVGYAPVVVAPEPGEVSVMFWSIQPKGGGDDITSTTLPLRFVGDRHIMIEEKDKYRFERTEDFLKETPVQTDPQVVAPPQQPGMPVGVGVF